MLGVTAVSFVLAAVTGTMQISSRDFSAGGTIPQRAMAGDCGGRNDSPQLEWSAAPAGTKSFALIVHDPDAPVPGGFYHWVVYNIPATTHRLARHATLTADQLGMTTRGEPSYYGPCPPPGPAHHYTFTLYALDVSHISGGAPLSATQLQTRMAAHILAHATLTATESHH
jgi:Raf kinase inhibitor-like YbhB/YbcL family protein